MLRLCAYMIAVRIRTSAILLLATSPGRAISMIDIDEAWRNDILEHSQVYRVITADLFPGCEMYTILKVFAATWLSDH